jgi:hypothetical protein
VPYARSALQARQPLQLTFDRFAAGFDPRFTANPLKAVARPGWVRFNPLVFRGAQEAEAFLMLDAMRAECLHLDPEATVTLTNGAGVRRANAKRCLVELNESNLLLLYNLDTLPGPARRALQLVLRSRIETGRLTVLALSSSPGHELQRFCARTCTGGLSVQMVPSDPASRRGILLRYLRVHGAHVDDTAIATRTTVPWECASDVGALGQRLLHAAYSSGQMVTAEMVGELCKFLGRHISDATASNPPRCCRNRLHHMPARGRWPWAPDESRPAESTVQAEFAHSCVTVEMRQRIWPDRFQLGLRADHEGRVPARFEIDITLQPRFAIRVRSACNWTAHGWGLTSGLTRVPKDPFSEARQWAYRALVQVLPRRLRESPDTTRGKAWADPVLGETMRKVRAQIREAARTAAALLDADTRKIALRFPSHMRPWLYRHMAMDTSGRLAQLARVCPGALTFAYALAAFGRPHGCGRAGGELLRGAILGQPLGRILDDAVAAWAAYAERKAVHLRTPDGQRLIWQRVADSQGNDRQSLLHDQRLLIRRAGCGVPSLTLWLPPPLAFVPEDIPVRKLDNARWFRVMKCFPSLLSEHQGRLLEYGRNLCLFMSEHALLLHKHEDLGYSDYSRISSLLDYSRAMNDWPRRSTSPARYLAAAEAWHVRIQHVRDMEAAAEEVGQSLVDADGKPLPFPDPPCPSWRSGNDEIVPLRTAEEVLAEGARMRNCVASRIPDVLGGKAFLYHGEVAGKSLTIQIEPSFGGYHVTEAKASANKEPRPAQKRVLAAFVSHLRVGERCVCAPGDLKENAVGR